MDWGQPVKLVLHWTNNKSTLSLGLKVAATGLDNQAVYKRFDISCKNALIYRLPLAGAKSFQKNTWQTFRNMLYW